MKTKSKKSKKQLADNNQQQQRGETHSQELPLRTLYPKVSHKSQTMRITNRRIPKSTNQVNLLSANGIEKSEGLRIIIFTKFWKKKEIEICKKEE